VLSFVRGMNNGTLLLKFQGWVWHDWVLDGVWVRGRWRCGEAKADFCKPRGRHVQWGWQNLGIRHNFWGLRWLWERLMRANLQEHLHLVDELLHSMGLGQNIILAVAGIRRVNCCIHQLNFCGHICKLLLEGEGHCIGVGTGTGLVGGVIIFQLVFSGVSISALVGGIHHSLGLTISSTLLH